MAIRSINPDLNVDPDVSNEDDEPVQPSEATRKQAIALTPPPRQLLMFAVGAMLAALVGGAVGFWLGKRQAPPPARPIRRFASNVDSALNLAPVAMNLLANPLVRTLALRIVLRQLRRRIER